MRYLLFLFVLLLISQASSAQEMEPVDVVVGKKYQLKSEALSQIREVFVGLPDNYYNSSRMYPVVYVLDGHGLFTPTQTTVRTLSAVHAMDETIVIGIGHGGQRNQDMGGGEQRDQFSKYLSEELAPWVEGKFRANDYAILIGHSLGGSFTWYQALKDSHTDEAFYNAMIAISPVMKRDGLPSVVVISDSLDSIASNIKHVHMSVGSENKRFADPITEMAAVLEERGVIESKMTYFPEESHGSVPMPAMYEAFQFIFDGWIWKEISNLRRLDDIDRIDFFGGIEAIQEYYVGYSDSLGYEVAVPEIVWSRLAWTYLNGGHRENLLDLVKNHGKGQEAVLGYLFSSLREKKDYELAEILSDANLKNHPESSVAWHQAASIFRAVGKTELMRSAWDKALYFVEDESPLRLEIVKELGSR